jgi:hypothetical protein
MKWRKLGHVFSPRGEHPWMASHAANPVADPRGGDLYRIYFSTRDASNRSSIAWVEVDMRDPCRVLRAASEPVLAPGTIGSFDDSGCSMGCIVRRGAQRSLYYMGWNLGVTVPWRNAIGLAVSTDGERFERVSLAPVMDRGDADPYTLSYPWILAEPDGWSMWYGSNLEWGATQADMNHMIKFAHSSDGRSWQRDGRVAVPPAHPGEYAFARPCVVRDGALLRMWYAFRGESYRIGYAESHDGRAWTRKDREAGISTSPGEWDSDSIEYPAVFDHGGARYMLYCGNGYGKTGFGIAVLDG